MKTTIFGSNSRAAPVAAGEESDVDDDFAGERETADEGSDNILGGVASAEVDEDDEDENTSEDEGGLPLDSFSGEAFNISEHVDIDSACLRDLLDENPGILPKLNAVELAHHRPSTPVDERPLEDADWLMM